MTALSSHARRLHTVVPDMSYVTKYTDQGPYPGNHWFWRDGRRNHGHNKRGQAVVRWVVKPSASSGWKTHGDFTIARLWIDYRQPVPRGAPIYSVCGLSQCINPDHWRAKIKPPPWRLHIEEGGTWQLVRTSTNVPAAREVVVYAMLGHVVHVVAIAPMKQRGLAAPHALCGAVLEPFDLVVTTAEPTCAGCL